MPINEHNSTYNIKKLVEYVGDNEETIKEMVSIFLKSAPELLGQMLEAYDKGDLDATSRAAHKLKPSLDVFGLDDLGDPIRKIEQAFKNNGSPKMILPFIELVKSRLTNVLQQMHDDYNV